MFVCKKSYANFALCNAQEINVQKIHNADSFIAPLISAARSFFRTVSLPELVARWLSDGKKDSQNKVGDPEAYIKGSSGNSTADSAAALVPFASIALVLNRQDPQRSDACDTAAEAFCVCRGPEKDKMIACDNENCHVRWFHFSCI